jgi:hypothetical protein
MRISVVLLLATMALTAASFFVPWWGWYEWYATDEDVFVAFSPYRWHHHSFDLSYYDAGMWGPVSELMNLVRILIVFAIALEFVVLVVVLVGSRQAKWISGVWMTVVLFVVLIGFAGNIGRAFTESSGDKTLLHLPYSLGFPQIDDFIGSIDVDWWSGILWGPMLGWWMMLLAGILAAAATYISTYDFEENESNVFNDPAYAKESGETERS